VRGAAGADARVATVAAVMSAQVLVEALRNSLKVEGLVATGMLDEALGITQPGISSSQQTAGVRITAGMLMQTKIALAAAMVLDSSSQVEQIATSVGAIAPNALPADVAGVLATDASTYLENAVVLSATATKQEMASIGQTMYGAGSTGSNLALSMPVVVSSVENAGYSGIYAVDGDGTSRWSSEFSDSQWIYVDLGSIHAIDWVVLNWETAYGKGYEIQVSVDARSWATVYTEGNGNGGIDDIGFTPVSARYVRVVGVQRGTIWGYSLWEIEVYGSGGGSASGDGISGGSTSGSGTTTTVTNTAPVTGTATTGRLSLSWRAPVARADGTPLSLADIDGYRIHYGKSSGNYTSHVTLADGTAQSVTLTDLPVGTYYMVMTTYDVDGRESGYSSQVSKTAQ